MGCGSTDDGDCPYEDDDTVSLPCICARIRAHIRRLFERFRQSCLGRLVDRYLLLMSPWLSLVYLFYGLYTTGLSSALSSSSGTALFAVQVSVLTIWCLSPQLLSCFKSAVACSKDDLEPLSACDVVCMLPVSVLLIALLPLLILAGELYGLYLVLTGRRKDGLEVMVATLSLIFGPPLAFLFNPVTMLVQTVTGDKFLPMQEISNEQGSLNVVRMYEPSVYYLLSVYSWMFDIPLVCLSTVVILKNRAGELSAYETGELIVSIALTVQAIASLPSKTMVGYSNETQGKMGVEIKLEHTATTV